MGYINGGQLLRVSGNLDADAAKEYEEAFAHPESIDPAHGAPREPAQDKWTLVDSGFGADNGYAWTIARVRNDDDHGGQTVTVNFNLRNIAGQMLASGSQVSHFSWPGQVLPVATQIEVPKGTKPSTIEATVLIKDDGTFDDQVSDDWGTALGTIYKVEYVDWYGARFEVKNPTDEPLESPSFQVVCTDGSGKIIGGGGTYPELIPASGSVLVDIDSLYTHLKPIECTGYLAPWM